MMSSSPQRRTLGLALSGGGSRAAAFHRGTLQGLIDLSLVDRIDVVSTVSGGSLFGGAWMAARHHETSDANFLKTMRRELEKGFILRSLRPRALKALIPGIAYSRTDAIADTFDDIFFHGLKLTELPERPELCINTTIMNNGQVGKFSRHGFSGWDLYLEGATPSHQIPMPEFRTALAVGASAAFPVGLPPVMLPRKRFPKRMEFVRSLEGARQLALTDGGVLENLGIQTLLSSERFHTWDMVVSDAGTAEKRWVPGSPMNTLRSLGVWILSGRTLERIMLIMNSKENRWGRQQVIEQIRSSWFVDALRAEARGGPGLRVLISRWPPLTRRNVLFVRVNQDWNHFMCSIAPYRLAELGGRPDELPDSKDAVAVEHFLREKGVNLSKAKEYYCESLGGDEEASRMKDVTTSFTALTAQVVDQLAAHAAWQIHAAHAIYGL